ncbi:MAG: sigma-54-dependent Fis family transcriptional regulator [Chlorobi bacterium]|nr:sigma-54-dependent Fis family transcriptional regulator [Chlorobiota bacterium]
MKPVNTSVAIITRNREMRRIIQSVNKIANTTSTVLLIGETGVGKEIFAEYIHKASRRHSRPLVRVSLSSIPHELLSSELFGYEKGAFTGAGESKKGLLEVAHTGTIFLDDIDDVPLDMQVKLLRFLENMEFMRVGGIKHIHVDVRVISASKVPLKILVRQKSFREDLYYRLNVVPVIIPPLRERIDDIPLLIEHFLKHYAPEKSLRILPDALNALLSYSWPGNVRELRNVIHRVSLFADKGITMDELPHEIRHSDAGETLVKSCRDCFVYSHVRFNDVVSCLEKTLIRLAMKNSHNNQSKAARLLGLSLSTFRDKAKKYSIVTPDHHRNFVLSN